MKLKRVFKIICYFIIFSFFININVYALDSDFPKSITINTDSKIISSIKYEQYTISAKRIRADGRNEVIYCLEIDEGYPSGQVFELSGSPEEKIDKVIASGYPSKTPEELNLNSEDEAYFATQIAVWSAIEGYDVNEITGNNSNIVSAIRQIYNEGMRARNIEVTENKEYTSRNKSIQQVVVVFDKIKYPKQEG